MLYNLNETENSSEIQKEPGTLQNENNEKEISCSVCKNPKESFQSFT